MALQNTKANKRTPRKSKQLPPEPHRGHDREGNQKKNKDDFQKTRAFFMTSDSFAVSCKLRNIKILFRFEDHRAIKIPNPKHQITNKYQIQNSKFRTFNLFILNFDTWLLEFIWDL